MVYQAVSVYVLKKALFAFLVFCYALAAWAGGSGLNVVVVVNQNSPNSVQLGNDFCEKRGVPPQNLFRITNWTGGAIAWSLTDFEAYLRQPLLAKLNAAALTNQVHYVLLSMDIPYRVEAGDSANSTTSALFYGFKTNTTPTFPGVPTTCSLPDWSSNSFALSELPFEQAPPNTADTNAFLAFMLTDETLAGAQAILNRALASDSSFPTQTVYLEKTSDTARNVRFFSFDNAIFDSRIRGDTSVVRVTSDSTSFNSIRGLLTGFATLGLSSETFVPGALGDSLTSYAGRLWDSAGQTTLLAFLDAGAAASYGTVIEPCNFLQKFPDPLAFFYQMRGFNAAEAYYQSLLNPFQGLFVGEPLSAPFATEADASWTGLGDGTILRGQATLPVALFSSGATNLPLAQVDLFVDGQFMGTLTNIPPSPGNVLSLSINNSPVQYTVPAGSTLRSVVAGLGNAVNLQSNTTKVAAFVTGDRVEFQGLDPSVPGGSISLNASAATGFAPTLSTMVTTAKSDFLDTLATGYHLFTVTNNTVQGDWLQLQITLTNGSVVTIGATNNTPDTNTYIVCQSLVNAINATPALQGPDGLLGGEVYPDYLLAQFIVYARSPGWPAAQIQTTLTTSPNLAVLPAGTHSLEDNLFDLRPRDHLYVSSGLNSLPLSFPLDTTSFPDGFHDLTLVAYEGTSVRTQTRVSRMVQIQNSSLSAVITPQLNGTNISSDSPLLVTVTANTNTVAGIELFGTGGSLGVISNQSSATFSVPTGFLGPGLHPFYALVTANAGNRFRTRTVSIRIVPSFSVAIGGQPLSLSWSSSPGLSYDVLTSANLADGFQKIATVTATSAITQWPIPTGNTQAFYRIRLQ